MKKIWVAMYVDTSDTCDGKPRVLQACATKAEAKAKVRSDMEQWAEGWDGVKVDYDKMTASRSNGDSCEWAVGEAEAPEQEPGFSGEAAR